LQAKMFSALEDTMDWTGCGLEHRHSSWIELDWVRSVGLDL